MGNKTATLVGWLLLSCLLPQASAQQSPLVGLCDPYDWQIARHGKLSLAEALELSEAPLLLLSGGGLAAGGPSDDGGREWALSLLAAAGVDAINLAHRDLRGDASELAAALKQSGLPFVAANLRLTGVEAPWSDYLLLAGGVACIGVAARSRAMELPGRGGVTGLQVEDPELALQRCLAALQGQAQRIVVLADVPRSQAASWPERFPSVDLFILSGRGGGSLEPTEKLGWAPPGGQQLLVCDGAQTSLRALPARSEPQAAFEQAQTAHARGGLEQALLSSFEPVPALDPDPAVDPDPGPAVSEGGDAVFEAPTLVDPSSYVNEFMQVGREPLGLEGYGIDPAAVNEAIVKGRKFLWESIRDNDITEGFPFGTARPHHLAALALLHAGAQHVYEDFAATLDAYLRKAQPRNQTYDVSLFTMSLDAYEQPGFYELLRNAAICMQESQRSDGSWGYGVEMKPLKREAPYGDGPGVEELGNLPPRERPWKHTGGDNSTSQFAMLALRSAHRRGMLVESRIWEKAEASFRSRQADDGGWGYYSKGKTYGSMTCAGLSAMLISRWALGLEDFADDPSIRQGMAWLAENFTVEENPGVSYHNRYYYLYSIERVGQLLGTEFIGEHEWYPEGVGALLGLQRPDGSWSGDIHERDPRVATSFALLFLTRATPGLIEKPGQLQIKPKVRFVVFDEQQNQVAEGWLGESLELQPGIYELHAFHGSEVFKRKFRIKADTATQVVVEP